MAYPKNPKPCTFAGCDRDLRAHGLCSGHLHQHNVGRELAPLGTYKGGNGQGGAMPKATAAPRTKKPTAPKKPKRPLRVGQWVWLERDGVRHLRQVLGYDGDKILLGEVEP